MEITLDEVSTIEEANAYAEKYRIGHNEKFARLPLRSTDVFREFSGEVNLGKAFCEKYIRKISEDLSVH